MLSSVSSWPWTDVPPYKSDTLPGIFCKWQTVYGLQASCTNRRLILTHILAKIIKNLGFPFPKWFDYSELAKQTLKAYHTNPILNVSMGKGVRTAPTPIFRIVLKCSTLLLTADSQQFIQHLAWISHTHSLHTHKGSDRTAFICCHKSFSKYGC